MRSGPSFVEIPPDLRARRLDPPTGRCRVVIDTDAANEIDDQFAIVWALQSPDRLDDELRRGPPGPSRHTMREAHGIDRYAVFRDFLAKLDRSGT